MKKNTLSILLTMALAVLFSAQGLTRSGGAPSARNGSPASNGTTCNTSGCHTGGGSMSTETITVTSNVPASGYQANTTYQITVKADDGIRNLTRIGFEASVEDNNGHIGTITSTGTRTKMTGSFITHTSTGLSPSNGANTWTFDWNPGTNPPANATVYVAANFANGNFGVSGDVIGTQTLALSQAQSMAGLPFQSFETSGGNWNFTINPAAYNTEGLGDDFIGGSEDVWDSIQAFTGDIDTSSNGIKFWGMQDLNNGNGGGSFGHTLDFDPVDVSSYSNAAISFDYYTDGYDSSDSLAYVAEFDSLSTWGTKVLLQKNSDAWVNVSIPIPSGSKYARLRIYAKQNGGSDFAGIDNVTIDTNASAPVQPTLPVYNISQVTTNDANGVADSLNVKCELRGTVFSIDFDGNNGYSFYVYDATGGVNVFNFNDVSGYTVQVGDSLRLFGEIDQFRGLTEMMPDSIIVASTGNSLKSPAVVSTLDETTEGEFIQLQNFTVVNNSQWPGSGSSANVDITNGTDTLVMRIDSDTDIDGSTAPTDTFDVTGAGGQFSFAANLDDGYQILPSSLNDIDTGAQGVITSPNYPLYSIAQVTTNDANGVADSLNVKCELRGTVFSTDFDGNNGYSFYVYDATGGVNVFNFNDVSGYTVQVGDSLRLFGEIDQFRGLTEMMPDSIIVASTGNSLKSPAVVSTLDETTEGEFIQLQNFTVVNNSQWPGSGSSANVDITNGTDTLVMRIDSDTDIDGSTAPTDTFDVTGAGGQFSFAANLDDGYQILPSSLNDIDTGAQGVITSPNYPLYSIAQVTTNDANGVADSLNVKCELRGTVFSTDFDGNNGYSFYIYDPTGGINVFSFNDVSGYSVQVGDSLRLFGEIDQFRGLTEMMPDSIIVASTGNSLKSPAVVSTLDETTEGEFIQLQNFTVVNNSQWPGSGSSANVDITNGTDTLVMRIDSDTDIDGSPVPSTSFDVQGAGGQFSFAANLDDGYQLLPSALADFTFSTPTVPTVNFVKGKQTVLEDAGTVTVKMSISPALTAMDTLTLLALPSANLTPADGFTTPLLDTTTGLLSLPLAMGADSAFFDITVIDDAVLEGNETLSVSLFGTTGSLSLGSLNSFDFIIQDNDKVIPAYDIADVTTSDASGVADSLNVECKLNGTVFTTDFRGSGGYQIYIKDGTGGINVFNFNDVSGYTDPKMGDSLRVIGTIIQFNGLTEIQPDSIVVLDTAQSLGQAKIVHDLTEDEEGEYIRLNGWSLINPMNWPAAGSSTNLDITNGQDTLQIRIDSDTDIGGTTAPVGFFDVIGVGSQFDGSAPYTEGYQFFPSRFIDFIPVNLPTLSIREVMPSSNHSSPVDGDWFEVENFGGLPINLQGFSWDDESREVGKHTINNNLTIDPNESVVLVEVLSPDDTTWIGVWKQRGNGLQVLNEDDEFNGFSGLSSGGDEVNLYDDGQRLLSSVSWSAGAVTSGFSLEFDRNGNLQGSAAAGVNGAYSSNQNDVGSPGNLAPVALGELLAHNLQLYPNPTSGILNIDAGDLHLDALTLTSLTGKTVRNITAQQGLVRLDFSNLPKGVYLLQINAEGQTVTRKVVLR